MDAETFCKLHDPANWQGLPSDMSMADFGGRLKARLDKEIETDQFKALVTKLDNIEHLRDIYPEAKAGIEALTQKPWDCPVYKAYYSVSITPNSDQGGKEAVGNEVHIVISKDGKYLLNDKVLDLSSEESLRARILTRSNPVKLVVHMESGVKDELLAPLFNSLAPLGIEDVTVLSEN